MGYRRSQERNKRLKKLYEETKHDYARGAWYNERKGRYIRYYPSNTPGYTKYFRRISNRRVRRIKDILKGGQYKKVYGNYYWIIH